MGPDGLYATVAATLGVFAWAWIGLGVLVVGLVVLTAVRSRHSSWVRKPEEIRDLPHLTTPIADSDERVA